MCRRVNNLAGIGLLAIAVFLLAGHVAPADDVTPAQGSAGKEKRAARADHDRIGHANIAAAARPHGALPVKHKRIGSRTDVHRSAGFPPRSDAIHRRQRGGSNAVGYAGVFRPVGG